MSTITQPQACETGLVSVREDVMRTETSFERRLIPALLTLAVFPFGGVHAQERGATDDSAPPVVLVSGKRASLESAQEIKRDSLGIIDSVVAEDITKLPDINVTDALQRITGVQILRDRGEGAGVAIRGLTQMETTLNGREIFTAGTGRTLDFADIPAELVAGIDVYKTSSANLPEGGVGGTIDLRTRRPFDFGGRQIAASVRMIHGDLVERTQPQLSLLASDRWKTAGNGEVGLLVNLSHQKRAWREDQKSAGNPLTRNDIVPGQTVVVPNGTTETTSLGDRERNAGSFILQWRPNKALELYAEGSYAEFITLQDSHQINVSTSPTFIAGSPSLFSGTSDLKSITWTNAPFSVLSFARDTKDRTRQLAVGGRWRGEALTLTADLSRTSSSDHLFFSGPILAGTVARFTQDLSTSTPGTSVAGTDLLDPANYRYTSVAYRTRPFDGSLTAARLDGTYRLDHPFFESVSAGVRLARRGAGNKPGLIFADANVTGLKASDKPDYVMPNPYSDFFPGQGVPSIATFLVGNLATARDAAALRNAFGITAPIPASASPLTLWDIREDTQAAYAMTTFRSTALPLDGNAGLRIVRTREKVSGSQTVPTSNTIAPIDVDSSHTDILPSANLRYRVHDGLYLRGAASKTVTRPDFNQLSPSLTLIPNAVNPSLNQGSGGNPDLQAVRSTNWDVAVERYYNPTTSVAATVFLKHVDGFVTTVSSPETHDGAVYQVSRPRNGNTARIAGAEVGYQQFFDTLPEWMRGLGMQANYTYVHSRMSGSATGGDQPLPNLSRHSANLVGMLEQGPISARIAYNWRDRFLSGFTNVVGVGALPIYTRGYGWLDASFSIRLDNRLTLSLEGTNLLRTVRTAYYGVPTRPQSAWINDRQISLVAILHL
jgi:TonB-dependent receptor